MSASFGVDFGQKVDLTASIRNILRNYPEGTAVLKELVQNADDAGASTVVFYLDYRNHSSAKLADQALEAFQGPSLLVYNDAIFTAEDFNSIQRIGDSLKKSSEESRAKIGRFGIGFNAVYHWTDLPSFISSNYLVMLDPQARFLPNVNPSNPGKMVDWIATPNIVKQFPDQFKPYEIDGLSWATPFKGTLFRLPLRTTEQAKTSLLSKRALSVTDAAALLNALRIEASAMLLFLKSVTEIEIREWKPPADASVPTQSTLVYTCRVTNPSAEMMRKRCLVSDKSQLQALAVNVTYAMAADYTLHIECTAATSATNTNHITHTQYTQSTTTYTEHWEICNQLGGPSANLIAAEPENALLRLIPWAGVAACVSVTTNGAEISEINAELVQNATIRDGLAYCFLPLPVRTGLPVMVNGFFELSSNRRDVWQAGPDMTGDGRTRALWNISIMKDLIAPSYSRMLLRVRDILGFSTQYQALWPNIRTASAPWDEVVRATLALSLDLKLLKIVTSADFATVQEISADVELYNGGAGSDSAKSKTLGLFAGFGNKNKGTNSTVTATTAAIASTWISCRAAVLLPLGLNATISDTSLNSTSTQAITLSITNNTTSATTDGDELTSYLVRAQASLVLTTETLKITLLETQTCTITATPEFVRTVLRPAGNNNSTSVPLPQMCKFLLKYCFSDLHLQKQKQLTSAIASALHRLPVLPVSDETVATLCIYNDAQISAISEVTSMGFSLSQTVSALSQTNFDILSACDVLSNTTSTANNASSVLLLLDESQLKVFHLATPVLLNRSYIAPNELELLTLPSIQKYSNVRTFSAQFIPDLLRYILPPACYHNVKTIKTDLSVHQHTELCEFLGVFWKYASTRADVVTSIAQTANVVPGLGLTSFYPLSRMANLIVRKKGDITLRSEMCDILSILGVKFVDPLALPDDAMMPSVFWEYVLSPTRGGVLAALDCVLRDSNNSGAKNNVFDALSAQQKDALRLYIATVEPVRQLTDKECAVVRNLPIFASCQKEPLQGSFTHTTEPVLITKYVAIGDNIQNNKTTTTSGNSKNNSRTPYATVVDYAHLPSVILPSHLLQHINTQDLQLLVHLQVTQLSRAQYFRSEFLPAVQYLYHIHPQECVQTILTMCDEVKMLCESDKHFLELLKSSAFIPCATSVAHFTLTKNETITNTDTDQDDATLTNVTSATANTAIVSTVVSTPSTTSNHTNDTTTATRLRRACELFDPTDVELTSLLDIQCFPNNNLIPVLQRAELLVLLRNIGLQTSLNWPSIVACARSIADMPDYTTAADGTTAANPRKTDRGRSLLKFLDKNISRLMQPSHHDTKKSSTNHSSTTGNSSVFPLFSFSTLFGTSAKETTLSTTSSINTTNNSATTATTGKSDVGVDNQPMEVYMEQLKLIPWVPVATEAPHPCMPWPATTTNATSATSATSASTSTLTLTAAPADTYPVQHAWLVSASKRLVTDTVHTPALQRLLGWEESIHVTVIAIQLRELSALYLKLYGNKLHNVYDSASSNTTESSIVVSDKTAEMQKLRETITGLIPQLYQRLNAAAGNSTSHNNSSIAYNISSNNVHDILTILESAAWIWVGDIFVTIDRVALNAGINATPYLYQLPQDLQVYSALLQAFQVKQKFTSRDYVEVLRTMAVQTGAISNTSAKNGDNSSTKGIANPVQPLSDNHLDICISLVTLLATESNTTANAALFATLYLPDSNGKLALCDTLINDDVPWLSGPEYISIRAGVRLVHPNISTHVCNVLGVKSLRLTLLSQTLEQSIFTLPTNAVESFGQAESLTNRLKTILDMYPDGNPIFSELIQNADDAGATIVSICIDENTYQCESLLDPKMAALQGPSLIVRNDAMFTESDFKSLAKIGQGSKLNKLNTTGRFGLGFNSTYHITDTPSFVSGDYVVIFDPHCHFVPGATMNQPGVRIKYTNTSLSTTFSDQFKPFNFFGCDLQSKYPGTLFRFPLRTASQARKSEISKRSYTIADVESNLAQLSTQLSNMLIFLRNVRTIEVYRCNSHSTTPTLLHRATAKVHSVETVNDQFLLGFFDRNNSVVSNGVNDVSRDGFYKRLMSTADNLLPKVFSQVHIETEVYIGNSTMNTTGVHNNTTSIDNNTANVDTTDASGNASSTVFTILPTEPVNTIVSHSTVDYVVSHGLCGGDAKRMACLESLRHFKLVPMGAVAACIHKSTTTTDITINSVENSISAVTTVSANTAPYPPLQGIAFCYLPLPVLTQLPVHVNGYFELSSNRRDIWKGDDTKGEAKMRSDWNICIMKDVLAPLYAALLVKLHAKAQLSAHTDWSRSGTAELSIQQVNRYQQQLHKKLLTLLPCPAPHDPWNNISSALFEHIKNANLLYSELGGGSFVPLKDAYMIEDSGASSVSSVNTSISGGSNVNVLQRVEQLLLQENVPVVRASITVLQTLISSNTAAGQVNPALVRTLFHINNAHKHPTLGCNNVSAAAYRGNQPVVVTEECMNNAIFWLQYALSDITSANGNVNTSHDKTSQFQSLLGLHLLPLEDNTLGTLQHYTDAAPYYLVNDTERRLLSRAGRSLVASEHLLGAQVYNILRMEAFAQVCNVRAITVIDTLKLVTTILPPKWLAAETVCAGRVVPNSNPNTTTSGDGASATTTIVSKEWLFSMWAYIIENNCIAMFTNMFPIIPVVYPKFLPEGEYIVKVSQNIPVLHMTYREIKSDVVCVLALLGVFICDPSVLEGKSYSAELISLLSAPSARGVLDALVSRVKDLLGGGVDISALVVNHCVPECVKDSVLCYNTLTNATPKASTQNSAAAQYATQCFILDSVIGKMDTLTATDIDVLCALPIWCTYKSSSNSASTTTSTNATPTATSVNATIDPLTLTFGPLNRHTMQLPPLSTNGAEYAYLLDQSFLRIRNEQDRVLYQKLGVVQPSMGQFYATHVLQKLQQSNIDSAKMDVLSVSILRNLTQLEKESPGLCEKLKHCAFVRSEANPSVTNMSTSSTVGTLQTPIALYDPQAPLLLSFLPAQVFPSSAVYSDVSLYLSLRMLGLQQSVSPDSILFAAKSIQRDFEQTLSTVNPASPEGVAKLEKINLRSIGLFSYLEAHIEDILKEISPASIHECDYEKELSAQEGNRTSTLPRAPTQPGQLLGGSWGAELRSITWVPVLTTPPSKIVHADLTLPWPIRTHVHPIATPSQCNSLSNIWLCSNSHRICSVDTQNAYLLYVLGWDKLIQGRCIAGQLLALQQTYIQSSTRLQFSAHSANEVYASVLPLLLTQLTLAFERESPTEIKLWCEALYNKPIVWMQNKFIETSRIAFHSITSIDLEPFLFIARPDLLRYKALLLQLGSRETFEAADLAALTRDLYTAHKDQPLSTYKLTLCVGILQILYKMLNGETIEADVPVLPVAEPVGVQNSNVTDAGVDISIDTSVTHTEESTTPPPPPAPINAKKVQLSELGVVYLPDKHCLLYPSTVLTFDDAPWMSAALHEANNVTTATTVSTSGIKFVSDRIDALVAMALGCKSLREQLFTGEEVHCPDAHTLRTTLDEDSLRDVLIDLVYVSDCVHSSTLHVYYDARTHPVESLLHPGLADTQGPAIVAYLEGSQAVNREVLAMLLSLQNMSTDLFRGTEDQCSPLASPAAVIMNNARSKFRRATGKKLLTTFAVTDCLQVLSGNEFYVFDPCGKYLLSAGDVTSNKQSGDNQINAKRLQSKLSRKSVAARETEPSVSATPRAQHYVINKSAQRGGNNTTNATQDALERFPDQFSSFLSLPFGFREQLQQKGRINGMVIRLPLRKEASSVSSTVVNVKDVQVQWGSLRSFVAPALVFAEHLIEVKLSHFESEVCVSDVVKGKSDRVRQIPAVSGEKADATAGAKPLTNTTATSTVAASTRTSPHNMPIFDLSVKQLTPPSNRHSRYGLVNDKGWQKQGFTKFFAKPFVPPEIMYAVILETTVNVNEAWLVPSAQLSFMFGHLSESAKNNDAISQANPVHSHQEHWLIAAAHGVAKLRELALSEPYLTMEMQPFVSIAVPILEHTQLTDISTPPDAGLYFNSAAAVGHTGLPFHIEGSFFQPHIATMEKNVRFGSLPASVSAPISSERRNSSITFPPVDLQTAGKWTDALVHVAIETLYPKVLFETKARIEATARSLPAIAATAPSTSNNTSLPTNSQGTTTKQRLLMGFYKYLPYYPRLTAHITRVLQSTTLFADLIQHPLFLQQSGFFYLHESLLPVSVLPTAVSAYISPILPLALCPLQLAVDLKAAKIGNVPALTASNLRATMANNALMHCSRLTNNAHLVTSLLHFVLTDITTRSLNEGEFTRRKVFREMAGVPLMPMANLNVKTFPRSAAEQVAIAPLILHALLPGLKNSFLHPTLTTQITLFADPLFLETLFISKFNASYMEYNIAAIVPARWRLVPAVEWENGLNTTSVGSAGRNTRPANDTNTAAAPSPLLVYILWNSFLSAESDWNQIEKLREYPLIPVVSRNRRLLLSMSLLSTVFADIPSSQQDSNRTHLKREIGRMTSLAMASTTQPETPDAAGHSVVDEWAWTTQPFSTSGDKTKHSARRDSNSAPGAANSVRGAQNGAESDDDLGDTVITDDFTDSAGPYTTAEVSVSPVANPNMNIPTAVATELSPEPLFDSGYDHMGRSSSLLPPPPPPSQTPTGPPPPPSQNRVAPPPPPSAAFLASLLTSAASTINPSSAVNGNIRRILSLLGVPFLDAGILEDIPVVIRGNNATGEGGANDFGGRRVLQCLHKLNALHVVIQPADNTNHAIGDATTAATSSSQELLCFDELTVTDRNALLLLIAVPQHQGMSALTATEQSQLKQLRLFTNKRDDAAVAIAECKGGVYWCREEAVLETISNRMSHQEGTTSGPTLAPDEAPIVLIYHESLLPVYTLLGIEELTAATAVRRFTVPHLRTMPALARLKVMLSLAAQWDSYRADQALVVQLKDLPFVPPYNSRLEEATQVSQSVAPVVTAVAASTVENDGNTLESCEHVTVTSLRQAKDVFLWTNDELLDALKGSTQSRYFPPPYMRTPSMHVMCTDLGMETELNEASFKRIVSDIQTTVNDSYSSTIDLAESAHLLREAADRGRSILRYVKANDRISTLLQNKPYAASIGKIKFVPMKVPLTTEAGGYVTYKEEIGRFDMLLARTHGTLAFTVMPIIDEDITPPQFYFSALGITGTPGVEIVLRHIRNLTSNGDSLDRWSAPYTITGTFNAIFQFLSDQWKTLSPKVKESLSGINLVPVGHLLIKPTRLFFRLAEDLSPFMHEIPRLYGAHEQFLKQIGIKESPTVTDYVRFLSDLASECGDCYLNPNELRAVVAILQVIATQSGDSAEQSPVESDSPSDSTKLTLLKVKSTTKTAELSMLYVPDEHSVMRPIAQCLVNDNEWYRGNATVLHHLHQTGLYLLHPSISTSVAENLHVDALTSVVSEQLDLSVSQDAAVPAETQAELQHKYSSIVTNPGFLKALVTLVQSNEHSKSTGEGVDALHAHPRTFAALTAVVQSIRFVFVRHIATKFILSYVTATGRESTIEFTDTNARKRLSFLNKTPILHAHGDSYGQELLVNVQMASTPPLTLNLAVAAGLCQRIGADLSLSYAIAALMESQGAQHMQSVLEALHVHMDNSSGANAENSQQRGIPGERVTEDDASLLELRPFRVYRIGEIVAYEVPLLSGAVEIDSVSGEKGVPENVSKLPAGGREKVYGKIVNIGQASEEGIRRLNVKIGATVVSVLSTEIFSFKSAREVNVSKTAANAGGLRVPAAMAALKRSMFGGGSAKSANITGPALLGKAIPVDGTTEEEGGVGAGDVSVSNRNELLGAVNGLLARAGVPIDLEQQEMISHILELESAKKRMEKELLTERQQLLQSKEQLETAANKLKCSICCTHDVYYVLVPCGHTTCEQCTDSWHGSGCPICRTRMQTKVRFFLPGADA